MGVVEDFSKVSVGSDVNGGSDGYDNAINEAMLDHVLSDGIGWKYQAGRAILKGFQDIDARYNSLVFSYKEAHGDYVKDRQRSFEKHTFLRAVLDGFVGCNRASAHFERRDRVLASIALDFPVLANDPVFSAAMDISDDLVVRMRAITCSQDNKNRIKRHLYGSSTSSP